jgi:hypothetical protein
MDYCCWIWEQKLKSSSDDSRTRHPKPIGSYDLTNLRKNRLANWRHNLRDRNMFSHRSIN